MSTNDFCRSSRRALKLLGLTAIFACVAALPDSLDLLRSLLQALFSS